MVAGKHGDIRSLPFHLSDVKQTFKTRDLTIRKDVSNDQTWLLSTDPVAFGVNGAHGQQVAVEAMHGPVHIPNYKHATSAKTLDYRGFVRVCRTKVAFPHVRRGSSAGCETRRKPGPRKRDGATFHAWNADPARGAGVGKAEPGQAKLERDTQRAFG